MFELTYRCSEKCIHCYNIGATRNEEEKSQRGDREELSLDEYKQLIDDLYAQGLVKVCLTGGDPFSKSFVWEIIDYLYNKDIAFDVFTNGQSIIKDIEKLANYYPRLVGVSIYSGIAEVHDYITRVNGSWERSMDVIRQLSSLAVPLNLKCCVMRPNVKSYFMVADIAKEYGAVFIIGIGGQFEDGSIHDGRAPDYDDWITETGDGHRGLNGDLLVWNPVLNFAFELSSMGIRVSPESLKAQLEQRGCIERSELQFHSKLLKGELAFTMGGGIGQSRLCMYLLRKAHIGETQVSAWPPEMIEECKEAGIPLL